MQAIGTTAHLLIPSIISTKLYVSGTILRGNDDIPALVLCLVAQSYPTLCDRMEPSRLLCPWGFSRQEYWSGLPCPSPGDLLNPGIEPRSPSLKADSLPCEPPGKPIPALRNNLEKDLPAANVTCPVLVQLFNVRQKSNSVN